MSTGTVDQIENEIRVWSFQNFGNGIALGVSRFMGKLLFAVLIFLIGRYCIRKLIAFLPTSRICEKIRLCGLLLSRQYALFFISF